MRKFLFVLLMTLALSAACGLTSCKAWRTVTTTSTYSATNDSTKTAISIQTKTVEEYQGVKK